MACYFCQDKCRLNDERKFILLPCEIGVVCIECFWSCKPIEKMFCKVCKSKHDCDLVDLVNNNQLDVDKINKFFEQHKKEYENLHELLKTRENRLNDHIHKIKQVIEQQEKLRNFDGFNSSFQTIDRLKTKIQNQCILELNELNLDMQKFNEFQKEQHILFSNKDKYSIEIKDNAQKLINHLSQMSIIKSKLQNEFIEKLNFIKNETGSNNVLNNVCGDIVCAFRIHKQEVQFIELKNMSRPRAMTVSKCDKLFITDVNDNSVAILDNNLQVIKYKRLNIVFNGMNGISNDRENHVLISDSGNHRLICFCQNFEIYLKTIGEYGKLSGHYNYPTHIAYHNCYFFVLDSKNSRIQRICTTTLTYDKVIDLRKPYTDEKLDQPKAMAVMNNVLAVCDGNSDVYLYDFDGKLFDILKYDNVESLCFANEYLFIHTSDGRLICYEKDEHTSKFSVGFNRFDDRLKQSSDHMVYFKGKLLILFGQQKFLAVI